MYKRNEKITYQEYDSLDLTDVIGLPYELYQSMNRYNYSNDDTEWAGYAECHFLCATDCVPFVKVIAYVINGLDKIGEANSDEELSKLEFDVDLYISKSYNYSGDQEDFNVFSEKLNEYIKSQLQYVNNVKEIFNSDIIDNFLNQNLQLK